MITPPGTFSPSSVASTSGPQRTSQNAKGKRRYNPRRSTRRKKDVDEEDQEDGWDVTLAHFRDKLNEIVYNGQPSGGLSPETALVAKIVALVKADLKRSVSRAFYCVLARHLTNPAILATAAPEHQSWRGNTPQGRGGVPHRGTERIPPDSRSRARRIG